MPDAASQRGDIILTTATTNIKGGTLLTNAITNTHEGFLRFNITPAAAHVIF